MNLNATIIGQSIAFAFFVWFCMKYVWPPVVAILEERANKIAEGLHAADRAEQDLVLAQERSSEQIKKAKQEAAAIIDSANKRAAQIVDEAREHAREEGQRIIAGANAEIEQEINRAKQHLQQHNENQEHHVKIKETPMLQASSPSMLFDSRR